MWRQPNRSPSVGFIQRRINGSGRIISGRSYLSYNVAITQERVGSFQTELVHDFMKALSDNVGMNLHLKMLSGRNPHHVIEAAFKALARAMDQATSLEPRVAGVLSTKGTLS